MANVTVTTAANYIPEVWAGDLLRHVRSNLVMANLVKRYDQDVKNFGDTLHIPTLDVVAARNKSAGSAVTFDAATEGVVDLSINKHKYFAFTVEDIAKVQARYDLREEYTGAAGYALAKAIDADLTGLYSGLSQSTTAADALTDAIVIQAIEYLDAADAPRDNRSFVIHSEQMADLRNLDKFTRYDSTGQAGVAAGGETGLVANVYGTKTYMSNNIVEATNVKKNLMFHKEAFALAMQQAPQTEAEYSVDQLGWKVAMHTIYGVVELRDTFGVTVNVNSP